jgi:hypothetical protein
VGLDRATETLSHRENPKILCVSTTLWLVGTIFDA